MKRVARKLLWPAVALLGIAGLVLAFRPTPVLVDLAAVREGSLAVTVADDGRTRVRERYTIHAPFHARLLRTILDPGDRVEAGVTVVAEFAPLVPDLLDERTRETARARLASAEAAAKEARARLDQAIAEAELADRERDRIAELVARQIDSQEALDIAEVRARTSREAVHAAEFALRVAEFEIDVAAAALTEPTRAEDGERTAPPRLAMHAPIDGVVLRVFEESERPLTPGQPLLELADTRSLEIVADFLSQDAVQVRSGMPATITGFGGGGSDDVPASLTARVRTVEPSGYTKISALGVEEQRVDIVLDPSGAPDRWATLGDGYRVDVAIEVWRGDGLTLVPTGALFRDGEQHAVFVDDGGVARLRTVRIGRRTGLAAEVLEGLSAGERVVLYPSAMVEDGTRIEER